MKTTPMAFNPAVNAETFDDIIFDGRNQQYGAYLLRKTYSTNIFFSLLSTLLMVLLMVGYISLRPDPEPSKPDPGNYWNAGPPIQIDLNEFDPPAPPQEEMEDLIEKQKAGNSDDYTIVDAVTTDKPPATQADLIDNSGNEGTGEIGPLIFINPDKGHDDGIDYDRTYKFSDLKEQASFKHGTLDDFRAWLAKRIYYSEDAVSADIRGTVVAKFTIDKEGNVCDVVIEKGIHPIIDQAVTQALLASPKWTPAKMNGRPVRVFYYVPVRFDIQH